MFVTDAQTLQDLSDTFQSVGVAALPAFWTNLNARNHARAYNMIVRALTARGFLLAQIAAWDHGGEYERDLTLWCNLVNGAAGQVLSREFIDQLDRRLELTGDESKGIRPCDVVIAGVFTDPQGNRGVVTFGQQDTSTDLFVPDSDDPRRGQETRW